MADTHQSREFALERIYIGTERGDPVGAEGRFDEGEFLVSHVRGRKQNLGIKIASQEQPHGPAVGIHHRQLIDYPLIHQRKSGDTVPAVLGAGGCAGRQGGQSGIKRGSPHQQATQIPIGHSALQPTIMVHAQQNGAASGLQRGHGFAQRCGSSDEQGFNVRHGYD